MKASLLLISTLGLLTAPLLRSANCVASGFSNGSIIRIRWLALGGGEGPLGCPHGGESAINKQHGRFVQFEHGMIASSPDQGSQALIALYQQDEALIVNWGDTSPFNYDFFIALVSKDERRLDQWNIKEYVDRTRGFWAIPTSGNGTYTVQIEGCDNGTISSTCRQGWTVPVSVYFKAPPEDVGLIRTAAPVQGGYEIDFSKVQPTEATDAAMNDAAELSRGLAISSYNACRKKPLATEDYKNDELDFVTVALGKLYVAEHNGAACRDVPTADYPRLSLRAEVNHALRTQRIESDAGTSGAVDCPTRSGEYDVMLRGYVTIMFRFRDLLAPDVRYRILHLLNKTGNNYQSDSTVCGEPETENHLLQIESSRYLTNQLLHDGALEGVFSPFYDKTKLRAYDNATNGMSRMMSEWLRKLLHQDFVEYNSRPYQTYALSAILNLNDYAREPAVGGEAHLLMEYLTAKYAVSNNMARRNSPYRRRVSHFFDSLLDGDSDPLKDLFGFLTGNFAAIGLPANTYDTQRHSGSAAYGLRDMLQVAAITHYKPSAFLSALILNRRHAPYFQRFHHAAIEIYDSEANFLISAGGFWLGSAYVFKVCTPIVNFPCISKEQPDDQAPALPTVLLPYGEGTNIQQMIRIEGIGQVRVGELLTPDTDKIKTSLLTQVDPAPGTVTDRDRVNTCVAPGFACGIDPVVPPNYLLSNQSTCWSERGEWTFVDRAAPWCTSHAEAGFYAVVHAQRGPGFNFGFFEARQAGEGLTFASFVAAVTNNNRNRHWQVGQNTYVTSDGREIVFTIDAPGNNKYIWPIKHTGFPSIDNGLVTDIGKWPHLQGDVLETVDGMVTIKDPQQKKALVLNDYNLNLPKDEFLPIR